LIVIAAKAEALYNSEAGQPSDFKPLKAKSLGDTPGILPSQSRLRGNDEWMFGF